MSNDIKQAKENCVKKNHPNQAICMCGFLTALDTAKLAGEKYGKLDFMRALLLELDKDVPKLYSASIRDLVTVIAIFIKDVAKQEKVIE